MGTSKEFNEKFIQWLWENKKVGINLKTISGKPVEIIFQGIPNFEDGPDFKKAIIKIDKPLKGDVEIHLVSRDWFSHKHNADPKYNNVILHIVLDVKEARRLHRFQELPALLILAVVHHYGRDVVDRHLHRVAEQEEQDDGKSQHNGQCAAVAQRLNELLANECPKSLPHVPPPY